MLSLGGVVLNSSLVWTDRHVSDSVQQEVKRTLGGRAVIFALPVSNGKAVTFQGTEEYGWLDGSQVAQLEAMASIPGAVYTLHVEGTEYEVVFRHNEAPAFEAIPLVARLNEQVADYYACSIKLLTV